ncbi:MAG: helix-turn-helix domain-containing protein [Oscillospiraceae bacterium]|jgi:transcriptional regulator with XRE-family HTH domain|nr:helix-turn-helix domain-containing protein [Oscillospiraceae bacterium]
MNITISENIKRLRRARDVTQESFAAALGVTPQSVSKWELGLCYPDIELIPLIANYFGISTDDLFGMDAIRDEARIDEFFAAWQSLSPDELLTRHRELRREFPNHALLALNYASVLYQRCYTPENCREAITVIEKLLEYCPASLRGGALFMLIEIYEKLGEHDNTLKILSELPPMHSSREVTTVRLLSGKLDTGLSDEEVAELRMHFGPFALQLFHMFQLLLSEKQRRGQGADEEYLRILTLLEQLYPYLDSPFGTVGYGSLMSRVEPALNYAAYYAESDPERAVDYIEKAVDLTLNGDTNITYPLLEYTGDGDQDVIVHDVSAANYVADQIAKMSKSNPQRVSTAADTYAAVNGASLDTIRENPRFVAAVAKLK